MVYSLPWTWHRREKIQKCSRGHPEVAEVPRPLGQQSPGLVKDGTSLTVAIVVSTVTSKGRD